MKLTENDLQKIKDAALYKFKNGHNKEINSSLWPAQCYIESFLDFCARNNQPIQVEFPSRQEYQSVDES